MPEKKGLNIGLWIAQVLLALMFGMSGAMKSFAPLEMIAENLPWVLEYPSTLTRFIGISELLGAIGLLAPSLTKTQPKLTVFAAIGLIIVMVLAAGFHISRGEYVEISVNVVLGALSAFVAWGRLKAVPIK